MLEFPLTLAWLGLSTRMSTCEGVWRRPWWARRWRQCGSTAAATSCSGLRTHSVPNRYDGDIHPMPHHVIAMDSGGGGGCSILNRDGAVAPSLVLMHTRRRCGMELSWPGVAAEANDSDHGVDVSLFYSDGPMRRRRRRFVQGRATRSLGMAHLA